MCMCGVVRGRGQGAYVKRRMVLIIHHCVCVRQTCLVGNLSRTQLARDRAQNPVPCGDLTHGRCRKILAGLLKIAGSEL